ncbi:uncharacterized protein JCM6883_006679 [Sporobolomyces salmoneus]|uniref:uncharacterized protein n=1 Tax=Sporobolomyces salmoneus TaxID=183962 RepID=UPI00316D02B3
MKVELHDLFGIFDTLQDLEVYIGQLPGIEDSLLPLPPPRPPRHVTRKLRRVVAAYPVDLSSFSRFILPSQATLTSLTISVTPENQQLDLSPFSNLTDLRLCLGASGLPYGDCFSQVRQQHLEPEERSRANGEVDKFAKNVQRLLRSARSTKSLSVSTSRVDVSLCLQTRHLFDTLPSSIVHFTMIYNILRPGGSNLGGFARALRARSFPHLRSIHVVRYVTDEELEFHDDELKKEDEAMKTTFQGAAEDPTLSVTCRWEQHDRVWSQHSVLHLCDTDEGAEDDADSSGENESEDEEELE